MVNVAVICVGLNTVVLLTVIPAPLAPMVVPCHEIRFRQRDRYTLPLHATIRADRGHRRWIQESLGSTAASERDNA